MNRLKQLLATQNYRLTRPRQLVFAALKNADHPCSLQYLIATMPEIDRTSIYRTLGLYIQLGIVEPVHIGWKKRYELAEPFKPHHHHLHCTRCSALIELDTPELEQLIRTLATNHGYRIERHHFELEGICERCQQKESSQEAFIHHSQ